MSEEEDYLKIYIDDDVVLALSDALLEKIEEEQRKKDSLLNLSMHSDQHLEGNLKLTFSTADGYCFCSKWKRFKTWVRNVFRRNKKQCCYGTGGLRSFWGNDSDAESFDVEKVQFIDTTDVTALASSGKAVEDNWFANGDD